MKYFVLYQPGIEVEMKKLQDILEGSNNIKTEKDFEDYIDNKTDLDFYAADMPFPTIVIFKKGNNVSKYNGAPFQIKLTKNKELNNEKALS